MQRAAGMYQQAALVLAGASVKSPDPVDLAESESEGPLKPGRNQQVAQAAARVARDAG